LIPPGKPTSELSKASIGVGVYAENQGRGIGKRLEDQRINPTMGRMAGASAWALFSGI
jgi:hypothetical protein